MEMEISCLTRSGGRSKIISVYMVHLQGISHQFEINQFGKFLNILGFLLLASEKTSALHF